MEQDSVVSRPSPAWQRAGLPAQFQKLGHKGQQAKILGRGSHGQAVLAWDTRTKRHVAVKSSRCAAAGNVFKECASARQASHPNVMKVLAAGENRLRGKSYLVTEYVPEPLRPGLGAQPRAVICGVLRGLAHMHRRGVVHGDLHVGNLRRHGERAVILDFGGATRSNGLWTRFLVWSLAEPRDAYDCLAPQVHGLHAHDPVRRDFEAFGRSQVLRSWLHGHLPRPQDLQRTRLFARLAGVASPPPGC